MKGSMQTSSLVAVVLAAAMVGSSLAQTIVREVKVGSTVVLPCPSNDDNHRFQFWQLVGDKVIGPGNSINRTKYKYEVLSGALYIKEVELSEAGSYKCVSISLNDNAHKVNAIELVVTKDWEEAYETDYETNVFRATVAVGTIVCIIAIAIMMFICWRRRSSRFRDMSDEESPDESPTRGTYSAQGLPSLTTKQVTSQGIDNPTLETDFPKTFTNIHMHDSRI